MATHPKHATDHLIDWRLALASCLRCRRSLSRVDRRYDSPQAEPDFCGFCGTPLTDQARAMLDPPRHCPEMPTSADLPWWCR